MDNGYWQIKRLINIVYLKQRFFLSDHEAPQCLKDSCFYRKNTELAALSMIAYSRDALYTFQLARCSRGVAGTMVLIPSSHY